MITREDQLAVRSWSSLVDGDAKQADGVYSLSDSAVEFFMVHDLRAGKVKST